MYWQAPSFSIIRLSILISRAAAKLVSDLDPSLQAAIDHLSLVRAPWHKRTENRQWLWAVCQRWQRNDFILYAGIGSYNGGDRNKITSACSRCVCFWMLAGGCRADPWQQQIFSFLCKMSAHQNVGKSHQPLSVCSNSFDISIRQRQTRRHVTVENSSANAEETVESLCWQSDLSASVWIQWLPDFLCHKGYLTYRISIVIQLSRHTVLSPLWGTSE